MQYEDPEVQYIAMMEDRDDQLFAEELAKAERDLGDMIVDAEAEYGDEYNVADLLDSLAVDYDPRVMREMRRRHVGWV